MALQAVEIPALAFTFICTSFQSSSHLLENSWKNGELFLMFLSDLASFSLPFLCWTGSSLELLLVLLLLFGWSVGFLLCKFAALQISSNNSKCARRFPMNAFPTRCQLGCSSLSHPGIALCQAERA